MLCAVYPERTNCRFFATLRVTSEGLSMTALFFHSFLVPFPSLSPIVYPKLGSNSAERNSG